MTLQIDGNNYTGQSLSCSNGTEKTMIVDLGLGASTRAYFDFAVDDHCSLSTVTAYQKSATDSSYQYYKCYTTSSSTSCTTMTNKATNTYRFGMDINGGDSFKIEFTGLTCN